MKTLFKLLKKSSCIYVDDELRKDFCLKRFKANKIRTFDANSHYCLKNTISHNLTAFEHFGVDFEMQRSKRLIFAVLADESINYNSKILIVGPRSENELIFLQSLGFKNVYGLDLISYSNLITLGDMHSIPFSSNKFCSVICGWTLSYSKTPRLAIREFSRVLKPSGCLAIGLEHAKRVEKSIRSCDSRLIDKNESLKNRINSKKDILKLFPKNKIKYVNYVYDAELKQESTKNIFRKTGLHSSQVMVVLKINK